MSPAPRQLIDNPPGIPDDQGLSRWQQDVADEMNSLDKVAQTQQFFARDNDPDDPLEGTTILWMTAEGDLKVKVTVGSVTKTATLVDFSAL